MAVVELTTDNFDSTVKDNDLVLIDFWAGWCGPCRQFAPVYETVSERHEGVTFGSVDTESQQQLAAAFEVRSIPTLAVIREGVLVYQEAGALPEKTLEDLIGQAKDLDMDEVRKSLA